MTLARACPQLSLLDVRPEFRIASSAQARNAYGNAAQEIVCAALSLRAIPIDGRCAVCFDAEDGRGNFFEIKSVRRGCKVVVYDWRMRKEAAAGVPLFYAVLVHGVRHARSNAELWGALASRGLAIVVLPAATVHALALAEPLRQMQTTLARHAAGATGYNRKGYADGYRNFPCAACSTRRHARAR